MIVFIVLAHPQLLAPPAGRAEQEHFRFARVRIKFPNHPQLEAAAFEVRHIEPAKRAILLRLGRLVILTAHEIAGCIRVRIIRGSMDNACPSSPVCAVVMLYF
jgi:hypothetical protein